MMISEQLNQFERLSPALTREWVADRKIVVFRLEDITRETIDKWAVEATNSLLEWPSDQPFLSLQDFSKVYHLTITPYLSKKSKELVALRPEIPGRTAIVLPPRFFMLPIIQGFVLALARSHKHRERRLFTSETEALLWLKSIA